MGCLKKVNELAMMVTIRAEIAKRLVQVFFEKMEIDFNAFGNCFFQVRQYNKNTRRFFVTRRRSFSEIIRLRRIPINYSNNSTLVVGKTIDNIEGSRRV